MKKIYLLALVATICYAAPVDFEKNLKETIKANFKNVESVDIVSKDKLKSIKGLNLVIFNINDSTNDPLAVFSSNDGKTILYMPKNIVLGDKDDEALVNKKISDLADQKRKYQEKVAYEILKTIPEDRILYIESFDKNNKLTMYMVTDPECPHCVAEISKLSKWLRNTHLKLLFAPVHGESARTKSAIILKKAKKIKPDDQQAMIKLLEKYYDKNVVVSKKEATEKERDLVIKDAKAIFSKGVVKGVPFTFVVEE